MVSFVNTCSSEKKKGGEGIKKEKKKKNANHLLANMVINNL